MSEMFESVNANSAAADAQALAEAMAEAEAQEKALSEWRRQQELRRKARIRRADTRFALHSVGFVLLVWGLCAAAGAGLMDSILAGVIMFLSFGWYGFRAGVWHQYRFGKGGCNHD